MERLSRSAFLGTLAGGLAIVATLSVAICADASAASRKRTIPAPAPQCPSAGASRVNFAKAIDGSTFLTTDGREVRLAGVLASDTETARQTLAGVLRTGALTLAADGPPDRYGRVVAEVFADGAWVQANLLKAGVLRAAPDHASAPCAKQMLTAEEDARAAHAGHWGDGTFSVRTPEQLRTRTGNFEIVEGTVTTATIYKGRAYINFGADYRTDFTVTVAPEDLKSFRTAHVDVKNLAGKRVRVRGWIELYNGPEIEVSTPSAIEILDTGTSETPSIVASTGTEARKDAPRRTRRKKPQAI